MRKRILRLVVTFSTHSQAMSCEKICRNKGLEGRLIPTPGAVLAGCGLAWKSDIQLEDELKKVFQENNVICEGFYAVELLERESL